MPAIATKERSKIVSIKLDISTKNRLDRVAQFRQRSPHSLMKKAMDYYLEKEEEDIEFIERAEKSMIHYEMTGLHITFDEFNTWADAIQINHNTPVPVCHI